MSWSKLRCAAHLTTPGFPVPAHTSGVRRRRVVSDRTTVLSMPCSHQGLLRRRRALLGWSRPRLFEVRAGYLLCFDGAARTTTFTAMDLDGCYVRRDAVSGAAQQKRRRKNTAALMFTLMSPSGAVLLRLRAPSELHVTAWSHALARVSRRTLADFRRVACVGVGAFGRVSVVEPRQLRSTPPAPDRAVCTTSSVSSGSCSCAASSTSASCCGSGCGGTAAASQQYAMKEVSLVGFGTQSATPLEQAMEERSVMERVSGHPFVAHLHCAFVDSGKLYFIQNLCHGGDLFDNLAAQKPRRFPERVVRLLAAELVLAVGHLHAKRVLHRDIKIENVLLDAEGHVRLADFGHAKHLAVAAGLRSNSFVGTERYCPPEMFHGRAHGRAVDWWQLGCLIFELLTGYPPFYQKDKHDRRRAILEGRVKFPAVVSAPARRLITGLLQVHTWERLGAGDGDLEEVQRQPFFEGVDWCAVLRREVKPEYVPVPRVFAPLAAGSSTGGGAKANSGNSGSSDSSSLGFEDPFLGFDYCWEDDDVACASAVFS